MHRTVTLDMRLYEESGDVSFVNPIPTNLGNEPVRGYKWVCKDSGGRRFYIYHTDLMTILKHEIVQGNLWQIGTNGKCRCLISIDRRLPNKFYLNYNNKETVKCI